MPAVIGQQKENNEETRARFISFGGGVASDGAQTPLSYGDGNAIRGKRAVFDPLCAQLYNGLTKAAVAGGHKHCVETTKLLSAKGARTCTDGQPRRSPLSLSNALSRVANYALLFPFIFPTSVKRGRVPCWAKSASTIHNYLKCI